MGEGIGPELPGPSGAPEVLGGRVVIPEAGSGRAADQERPGVAGSPGEDGLGAVEGRPGPTETQLAPAQHHPALVIPRIYGEEPQEMCPRLAVALPPGEQKGEVPPRRREGGVDREGFLVGLDRRGGVAPALPDHPQPGPPEGKVTVHVEGGFDGRLSAGEVPPFEGDEAQICPGLGKGRAQLEGEAKARLGAVEVSLTQPLGPGSVLVDSRRGDREASAPERPAGQGQGRNEGGRRARGLPRPVRNVSQHDALIGRRLHRLRIPRPARPGRAFRISPDLR